MSKSGETARRQAAEWHVLLDEEPDDPGLRARFRDWLDADRRHAEAWRSMQLTTRGLAALSDEDTADADDAANGTAVAAAAVRGRRPWARRAALGLAAALVLLFGATQGPDVYYGAVADHATAAAETREIELADGSTVRLAPETAIEVAYSAGRRDIRLLAGTAHFSVVPDADRPFAVATDRLTATVLGTEFDVGLRGDATSVEVRSGHVRVSGGADRDLKTTDLRAGDWLRVDAGREVTTGRGPPELVGGWWSGRMMVRGREVADVVSRLRPWFSGQIVLLDGTLGSRRVTGVYDPRDPAAALDALVSPHGGRVIRLTPWALVVTGG